MPTRVDKKPSTTKRMFWMIGGVLLLIAVIAGIKVLLVVRMIHGMPKPAPFTVSTATAREQPWQPVAERGRHAARGQRRGSGDGRRRSGHRGQPEIRPGREAGPGAAAVARR